MYIIVINIYIYIYTYIYIYIYLRAEIAVPRCVSFVDAPASAGGVSSDKSHCARCCLLGATSGMWANFLFVCGMPVSGSLDDETLP